ncbi:hypothetical protein [Chitinophaga parva]|nr:hypothetical protein [Chitinophaga parva]
MEKKIDLISHRVALYWFEDLQPGAEVFAVATSLVSACIAVEMLLDQMGLRDLWYGQEVTIKDGIFKIVLESDATHWEGWQKVKRLALTSKYRP